jgi:hypothetical protein
MGYRDFLTKHYFMNTRLATILDVYTNASYAPIEDTFNDPKPGYASDFYKYFRRRFYNFIHQGGLITPPVLPKAEQTSHSLYYTRLMAVIKNKCEIDQGLIEALTVPPARIKEADAVLLAIPCGFFFKDDPARMVEKAMALTAVAHPGRNDLALHAIAAACITAGLYRGEITEAAMMPLAVIRFFRSQVAPFTDEEVDTYLLPWEKYARIQLPRGKTYRPKSSMIDPALRWRRLVTKYVGTPDSMLGNGGLDTLIASIDAILLADDRFASFFNNTVLVFGNNRTITLMASLWYECLYPNVLIPEKWMNYG